MQNLRVSYISQEAGGLIQPCWDLPKMDAELARLRQHHRPQEARPRTPQDKRDRETWGEYNVYSIAARNAAAVSKLVGGWTPSAYRPGLAPGGGGPGTLSGSELSGWSPRPAENAAGGSAGSGGPEDCGQLRGSRRLTGDPRGEVH